MMLPGKGFDFGNYKSGFAGAYAMLMDTAREFGDYEIADAAQRALDQDCGRADDGGVLRYSKGSNLSNAMAMRARIHRRDDFRRTIAEGPPEASLRGPILTDAKYPDVLVARAFSNGDDLDLVLYPGAKPGPQETQDLSSVCARAQITRCVTVPSTHLPLTTMVRRRYRSSFTGARRSISFRAN